MSVITTGAHPKALWPGVHAWFGAKYDEHPTRYTDIFDVRQSNKNYEELVQHYGFGLAPKKPEGQSTSYADHAQGYISRFTNVAYSMGYIVTKEEIDDNLYESVAMQRAASLAFSMRQTKETVGANVLNRAFTATYSGGDGKELLATDHPNAVGGTYSNELATAADLSEASLEDLAIQIRKAKDDVNLRIQIQPRALIVPPDLEFDACRILDSIGQSGTANNDVNALRLKGTIPEGVKVNEYLTDADAWFVKTDCPDGMIMFERNAMEFTRDNDFDTENAKAKAYERYVFGWANPRGMYGSPGA